MATVMLGLETGYCPGGHPLQGAVSELGESMGRFCGRTYLGRGDNLFRDASDERIDFLCVIIVVVALLLLFLLPYWWQLVPC